MFTKEEIRSTAAHFWEQDILSWSRVIFEGFDTNGSIKIYRAPRSCYDNAALFWLDAAFDDYLHSGWDAGLESLPNELWEVIFEGFVSESVNGNTKECQFSFLTLDEKKATSYLADSIQHHPKSSDYNLELQGQFIGAMQMDSKWNKFSILAEFEQEFILFYWMAAQ